MKKTKVLLAGALVLALGLVMGCKQNSDLSVEEHRQGADKYEHIWEATYGNNDYIRSALQFGTAKKVNAAKVKVKLYPKDGKAGLLFAVNPRKVSVTGEGTAATEKTVYDFYAFAFGKKPGVENKLEAYVDYYQGLERFNDSGTASAEKFGQAAQVELKTGEFKNLDWNGSGPVTAVMSIGLSSTEGSDDTTWTLKITSEDGQTEYWSETGVSGKDAASRETDGLSLDHFKNEGAIYSYGMLSGLSNPKTADTRWTLDRDSLPSGVILAAEEE